MKQRENSRSKIYQKSQDVAGVHSTESTVRKSENVQEPKILLPVTSDGCKTIKDTGRMGNQEA